MPAPFVENAFFLPLYNFCSFVKNQVFIGVWINIRVFNSIPLINVSVFMSISSCFHYCGSVIEFEVWDGNASGSTFIVQDCFGYPGFFVFPYKVDYCSLKVCEEFLWDFDGDCIESIDYFWQNWHFYYVDPPNPRAREILQFSGILFNFFSQRLTV